MVMQVRRFFGTYAWTSSTIIEIITPVRCVGAPKVICLEEGNGAR